MSMPLHSLVACLLGLALCSAGCTTKFTAATNSHRNGDFDGAVKQADALCPTVEKDGKVQSVKVSYERDAMWIGVEKATILLDAGRLDDARRLYAHVDERAAFLRAIESAYLNNPIDPANWDAGQFAEDAGQAVLGADQTTYLLQPYEMILVRSYLGLCALLAGTPGAESIARSAQRYQEYERVDLESAGEKVAQPPVSRMDGVIRGSLEQGQSTEFTVAGVFSLGDFSGSKERTAEAIRAAQEVRAADPRMAFASAVAWASFMRSGQHREAEGAARAFSGMCGATDMAASMATLARDRGSDYVLVLVDAGRGPTRRSFNVRVPIIIPKVGSTVFRGVYPDLQFHPDDRPSRIDVIAGDSESRAVAICSIEAIAARNFRRREPELWWGPTIRAAIRSIAAIVAQATQDEDDSTAKLLIALGSVVVAEAEQPDLRAWSTLPATQHGALVRRPADGKVRVRMRTDSGSEGVVEADVPAGASIVYVRALTPQIHAVKVGPVAVARDR